MSRLSIQELPQYSFFVKRALMSAMPLADEEQRLQWLAALASEPYTLEKMKCFLQGIKDTEKLADSLRLLRREVLLTLIARDATGLAQYEEVVKTMTDLAQLAVSQTVRIHALALSERFGIPTSESGVPQDFLVVGMGKLGGQELNVSSDIDLVFVYDEQGRCRPTESCPNPRRELSNAEFFERLSKKVIAALSDISGAGFVFRVDMRLRPNGDSGPIVISNDMLEEYLYVQGREWERFAWLKGRVVNEPVFTDQQTFNQQVKNLYDVVRPFVFRRYVDFNAISALSNLHKLIRSETQRREAGKDLGIQSSAASAAFVRLNLLLKLFK